MALEQHGIIRALLQLRMHGHAKTGIVISVSLLLLYYGSAWAVLRCCHDDTRVHQELALGNTDGDFQSDLNRIPAIECADPLYHAELMAEFPLPPRLGQFRSDAAPPTNDFFASNSAERHWPSDLHLRAVFESSFAFDSPRYLSFSILRI